MEKAAGGVVNWVYAATKAKTRFRREIRRINAHKYGTEKLQSMYLRSLLQINYGLDYNFFFTFSKKGSLYFSATRIFFFRS